MLVDDDAPKVRVTVGGPGIHPITRAFVNWQVRIGSAASCELQVPSASIAPVHVELRVSMNGVYVVDLSGGRTWFKGSPVSNSLLPYGRVVRLVLGSGGHFVDLHSLFRGEWQESRGTEHAWLKSAGVDAPQPKRDAHDAAPEHLEPGDPSRRIHLVRVPIDAKKKVCESTPSVTGAGGLAHIVVSAGAFREEHRLRPAQDAGIGRGRRNLIRVPEQLGDVSGEHARLIWENGWLVLEDLQSTNGTELGTEVIDRVVLRPGVEHRISLAKGVATVRVWIPEPAVTAVYRAAPPLKSRASDRKSPVSALLEAIGVAETTAELDAISARARDRSGEEWASVHAALCTRREHLAGLSRTRSDHSLPLYRFLWGAGMPTLRLSTRHDVSVPAVHAASLDALRGLVADSGTRVWTLSRLDQLLRTQFLEAWLHLAILRSDLAEVAASIRRDSAEHKALRWCRAAGLEGSST